METRNVQTQQEGYKTAFKATALFGGVQIITILIQILKSKVVAVWLGTTGFGIMSLFNSTITLIYSITNLGLQDSAVRDIAHANGQNDRTGLGRTVKAIGRWILCTGIFGAAVTVLLSPWLSRWLFESNEYVISFVLLSSVVLMSGIYYGNYAVLQGTRHLTLMAKANIFGALASFICSLPIFYFFREQGIVWALILTAFATLIVSSIYVRKTHIPDEPQKPADSWRIGLGTVKLGIMMSMSGISVSLVQFAIKTFIVRSGGIDDVGLYQAGWALNATYLGLVFTAMAKDYYPRLAQSVSNKNQVYHMVNQQTEIALLLVGPLIIGMIVFMPLFIRILYSPEFMDIVEMTKWLLIGSLVRAGAWGLGYLFLARGDGKLYLFNELGTKIITLPAYLLSYHWWGLAGIGYAFTFNTCLYFLVVSIVAYRKYELSYSPEFWRLFVIMSLSILAFPLGERLWNAGYATGIVLILLCSGFSLYELNKRIDLRDMLSSLRKRK